MEKKITFNKRHFIIKGKPTFLFGGDFCYARCNRKFWEDRILKLKQAGCNTITFYVPWNYHQPAPEKVEFEGNKDLGAFIATIGECGMYAVVRMGPFIHGEWKNGGLPDWLFKKLGEKVRTNDPEYFKYTEAWYLKLIEIIKPWQITEGGPVIMVQVENELGSSGCKGDDIRRGSEDPEENRKHILKYHQILRENGIKVPFLDINTYPGKEELKNVVSGGGGYMDSCFYGEVEPGPISLERYEKSRKPIFSIEIQGGMFQRFFDYPEYLNTRTFQGPIVEPERIESLSFIFLAEGYNTLGYYILVDGKNPDGLSEGMLPEKIYNYQAPVSSCGTLRPSYHVLKRLGWFTRSFQKELLTSEPKVWAKAISYGKYNPLEKEKGFDLFEHYEKESEKVLSLPNAYAQPVVCGSRVTKGLNLSESNFVFLINYSKTEKKWLRDIHIVTSTEGLSAEVPRELPRYVQLTLQPGESRIIPFYVKLDKGKFLEYSTVSLLDRRKVGNITQVIFYGKEDEIAEIRLILPGKEEIRRYGEGTLIWESPNTLTILASPKRGLFIAELKKNGLRIILLSKKLAEEVWEIESPEGNIVAISNLNILISKSTEQDRYSVKVETMEENVFFWLFTPYKPTIDSKNLQIIGEYLSDFSFFKGYGKFDIPQKEISFDSYFKDDNLIYETELESVILQGLKDIIFQVDYDGSCGKAYLDNYLISDHYLGKFQTWEFGIADEFKGKSKLRIILHDTKRVEVRIKPVIENILEIRCGKKEN